MKRFLFLLAVALGVVVLPLSVPAPASADVVGGGVSAADGVLYPGCVQHPVSYTLSVPPGAQYWNLSITAYGPDGLEAGSAYLSKFLGDATTGTETLQFCPLSDGPGAYRIVPTGEWTDYDYHDHVFTLPSTTVTMRSPATATSIRVSPRHPRKGAVFKVVVQVSDERPAGYFPTSYAEVVLQYRRGSGAWQKARKGRARTDGEGRLVYRYRFDGKPAQLRAVTASSWREYDGSVSRSVRLRR